MKILKLFIASTLMLMIYTSPAYAEYSYQLVIPPGAVFAQAFGINNAGKVTGGADDGITGFSFMYDMKSGEYTVIDNEMGVLDISNPGVMVGDVGDDCAIRDKQGNITTFFPPSWTVDSICRARGVNPDGKVSGFVIDEFGGWLGFIYDSEYGTYEEFLPSPRTLAHAINAQGQNVGTIFLFEDDAYPGSPPGRYGYLRQEDGSVKYFAITQSVPGHNNARGISENGKVAGWYYDPAFFEATSYVTSLSAGTGFEEITLTDDELVYQRPCDPELPPPPPGYEILTDMFVSQVRNDGVVVGQCTDYHYDDSTGDFIEFTTYGYIATPIK